MDFEFALSFQLFQLNFLPGLIFTHISGHALIPTRRVS